MKRLQVLVYIGKGYVVTEKGNAVMALAYKDGRVGYTQIGGAEEQENGESGWYDVKYEGSMDHLADGIIGRLERNLPWMRM